MSLFVIEEDTPFRSSILWRLQDQAYAAFGPAAWSEKGVPSYLTSHPLLARAYAEQIRGFLRDCNADSATIVDLGAGTGRLAYYLLRELDDVIIDYVVTDITQDHLEALRDHPKLKPYFESKRLHTYLYHHDQHKPPLPDKPTIVIANYYLDTLPQTLFRANQGDLEEGFVTLRSTKDKAGIDDIAELEASYSYRPAANPLAQEYASKIHDGVFLDPHGGLQTLREYIAHGQPLLILTADQGVASMAQMKRLREPKIARHGTFSVTVHYHYLAFVLENQGLSVILPQIPDTTLVFMAATNCKPNDLRRAYKDSIDTIAPTDYYHLSNALEKASPNLQEILSLIKLGLYDPINTYLFFPRILELAKTTELTDELAHVLMFTALAFYPINAAEASFYNQLGALLFELEYYPEALICFQQLLYYTEPTEQILKNMAACVSKL